MGGDGVNFNVAPESKMPEIINIDETKTTCENKYYHCKTAALTSH